MLSSIPFVLFATTQEGFHSIRLSVSRHKPLISCFLCSTFQIHMIFDAIEECRALNILECCSDLVNNRLAFRRALGSTLAGAFRVNRYIRTAFLIVDDSNLKVTGYSGVHLLIDGNQTAEFLFQELSEGLAVRPIASSSAILDPYKQDLRVQSAWHDAVDDSGDKRVSLLLFANELSTNLLRDCQQRIAILGRAEAEASQSARKQCSGLLDSIRRGLTYA